MRVADSWSPPRGDRPRRPSTVRGQHLKVPEVGSELVALHHGSIGSFFLARCPHSGGVRGPIGYIEEPHFVFPLAGSYIWHAGREDVFADANHVLSFPGREEYAISHPVTGDVSLAVWPNEDVAARLYGGRGSLRHRRIFGDRRSWPLPASAQLISRQLVKMALSGSSQIALDDIGLRLLKAVGEEAFEPLRMGRVNPGALRRAKEFIQANPCRKLTLDNVAAAAGLNPIYLSQMFTAAEGIPLAQYMRKLRLAHTLNELDQCEDITALALDSGFSSHSHFTSAFNDVFMTTPSAVRTLLGADTVAQADEVRRSQDICMARIGGSASAADPTHSDRQRRQP